MTDTIIALIDGVGLRPPGARPGLGRDAQRGAGAPAARAAAKPLPKPDLSGEIGSARARPC
ncbi:hypothetical protein [Paracoccus sp. S-4012]|uniref:hypothetical protein n=1 Tax=Paracoccus sp. S-4012 TaxID=2665648 RepID=UPI001E2C9E57|nr:hypothetical protein [Paracoccus sp. S-4012]